MNAEQFAKSWSGYKFRLPEACLSSAMAEKFGRFLPRGKLVGYITGSPEKVVLEFDEATEHYWPLHSGVTLTIDREDMYHPSYPMVLAVNYKLLAAPRSGHDLKAELTKKKELDEKFLKKPIYPQICAMCNSPARKYGKQVMCSNRTCKTRSMILKSIDYKPPKIVKTIPICCNNITCESFRKAVAVYVSPKQAGCDGNEFFCIEFECGHDCEFFTAEFVVNNIIYCTRFGYDNDRIWNGTQWVNI